MVLKDFDFGASSSIENSKVINSLCHGLSHLYFITLGKIESPTLKKIIVTLTPTDFDLCLNSKGSMPEVYVPIDEKKFLVLNSREEKLRFLLALLQTGLSYLINEYELDRTPFLRAFDEIDNNPLSFAFYYGNKTWNRDKTISARLFYEFDLDNSANIGIELSGKIKTRKVILTVLSDWMFIYPYMGNLKWQGNESIILASRDKKENFEFLINK